MDIKNTLSCCKHKSIITTHALLMVKDEILLLLRKNTGYSDGLFGLVGGTVDANETIIEATIREIYEEAGVIVLEQDLKFSCVLHRAGENHGYINFFYTVNKWYGSIKNFEPHKCKELTFYRQSNLPENTIPYIKQALDHIDRSIIFAEIYD